MLTDRLAELIARSLSREATPAELEELEMHMRDHPEDQYFREILLNYWNTGRVPASEDDTSSDQHFKHILALADDLQTPEERASDSLIDAIEMDLSPQKKTVWLKRIGVAVILAGIIFGTVRLIPAHQNQSRTEVALASEIIAKKGSRIMHVLSDGSKVWLNSESKLVYPEKFSGDRREVSLDGEAYFDVVKDSVRPFIVHTTGIDVHVLGTIFNVRSYADEPTIETTLIRGKVEIVDRSRPGNPSRFLTAHEKASYKKIATVQKEEAEKPSINNNQSNAAIDVKSLPKNIADSSIRETFWVYNKLSFGDGKFREVAKLLERWYNVTINFNDDRLADLDFHASFLKDEPVEQALKELQLIAPFFYSIAGDEIKIDRKR